MSLIRRLSGNLKYAPILYERVTKLEKQCETQDQNVKKTHTAPKNLKFCT